MEMRAKVIRVLAYGVLTLLPISSFAQFSSIFGPDKTVAQQREDIFKNNQEILASLYKVQRKAKEAIETAVVYATFSNFGM